MMLSCRWVLVDLRVRCLTVSALSMDNLRRRDPRELELLYDLFVQVGRATNAEHTAGLDSGWRTQWQWAGGLASQGKGLTEPTEGDRLGLSGGGHTLFPAENSVTQSFSGGDAHRWGAFAAGNSVGGGFCVGLPGG